MTSSRTRSFRDLYVELCGDKKLKGDHSAVTRHCRDRVFAIQRAEQVEFDHWELVAQAARRCTVADLQILSMQLSRDYFPKSADEHEHEQEQAIAALKLRRDDLKRDDAVSHDDDENDDEREQRTAKSQQQQQQSQRSQRRKAEQTIASLFSLDLLQRVYYDKRIIDLQRHPPAVLARVARHVLTGLISTSPHIKVIHVNMPFGDENITGRTSVVALLGSPSRGPWHALETVSFCHCQLTDRAARPIVDALLRLPSIKHVALAGNMFTDEAFTAELSKLLLWMNPTASRAQRAWKSALVRSASALRVEAEHREPKATEPTTMQLVKRNSDNNSNAAGEFAAYHSPHSSAASRGPAENGASATVAAWRTKIETLDLSFNELSDASLCRIEDLFETAHRGGIEMSLKVLNLQGNHFTRVLEPNDAFYPPTLMRLLFSGIPAAMLPEAIPESRWDASFDPHTLRLVFAARCEGESLQARRGRSREAAAAKRQRSVPAIAAPPLPAAAAAASKQVRLPVAPKQILAPPAATRNASNSKASAAANVAAAGRNDVAEGKPSKTKSCEQTEDQQQGCADADFEEDDVPVSLEKLVDAAANEVVNNNQTARQLKSGEPNERQKEQSDRGTDDGDDSDDQTRETNPRVRTMMMTSQKKHSDGGGQRVSGIRSARLQRSQQHEHVEQQFQIRRQQMQFAKNQRQIHQQQQLFFETLFEDMQCNHELEMAELRMKLRQHEEENMVAQRALAANFDQTLLAQLKQHEHQMAARIRSSAKTTRTVKEPIVVVVPTVAPPSSYALNSTASVGGEVHQQLSAVISRMMRGILDDLSLNAPPPSSNAATTAVPKQQQQHRAFEERAEQRIVSDSAEVEDVQSRLRDLGW